MTTLKRARILAHTACQWPSRAARANLAAEADDSHANFGWDSDSASLISRPLDAEGKLQLGFSFASAALVWINGGNIESLLSLNELTESQVGIWVDEHLVAAGVKSTGFADMPYELDALDRYQLSEEAAQIRILGDWMAAGFKVLSSLSQRHAASAVNEVSVRCWPHHFDVGALFFLDRSDPEIARSVGVGLSPGDSSFDQPYFYCSPWPVPALDELPAAPGRLSWHTEGFVSLVLTDPSLAAMAENTDHLDQGVAAVLKLLTKV